jgi:hypothetical protein
MRRDGDQMVEVTVTIDFGPAGGGSLEKTVALAAKSTVFEALTAVVPVITAPKYGMECFVEEIQGIKNDFAGNRGWQFEVNGRRSDTPAERYLVKNGDWIKWLYLGDFHLCGR